MSKSLRSLVFSDFWVREKTHPELHPKYLELYSDWFCIEGAKDSPLNKTQLTRCFNNCTNSIRAIVDSKILKGIDIECYRETNPCNAMRWKLENESKSIEIDFPRLSSYLEKFGDESLIKFKKAYWKKSTKKRICQSSAIYTLKSKPEFLSLMSCSSSVLFKFCSGWTFMWCHRVDLSYYK